MWTFSINLADFIAVIISAGAIYFTIKNRRNGLREKIFEEQIFAFKELSLKISRFEAIVMDYNAEIKVSGNKIEKIREKIWEITDEFMDFYTAIEIFIPEEIDSQFLIYHKHIDNMLKEINSNSKQEIDINALSDENYTIQNSIREFLGLESLSKENKRLSNSRYL